jgi:hypothetical protein
MKMWSGARRALPGATVLVLLAVTYLGGCKPSDLSGPAPDGPAVTATAVSGDVDPDVLSQLAGLDVVEEPTRSGYSRDLFRHWNDPDGNGCDARQDALIEQALGPVQRDPYRCHVIEGDWYSVYDGVSYSGPAENLDVDHVVSLAEAWDSGADSWTDEQRSAFANDPINLLVVSASSNRSKRDADLGEWQPEQQEAWCLAAIITIETKAYWDLSIDPAERRQLEEMAQTCAE